MPDVFFFIIRSLGALKITHLCSRMNDVESTVLRTVAHSLEQGSAVGKRQKTG